MSHRASRGPVARVALAGLLLAASVAACGIEPQLPFPSGVIVGEGGLATEQRDLAPFTRVSVAGEFKVILGEADKQEIVVGAQPNLLAAIRTEVVDGQLIVTIPAPGIVTSQPLSLTVRAASVESVALSNGAVGYLEHTGDALNLDVSGASRITVIGTAAELHLTASTGGHAELGLLLVDEAVVNLNDGSSAELNVTSALSGIADGGSTITLGALPKALNVKTRSGASILGP